MEKIVKILAALVTVLIAVAGYQEYQKSQKKKAEKIAYEARIAEEQAKQRRQEEEREKLRIKAEKEETEIIGRAQKAMTEILKDPDSAQYRDLTVHQIKKDKAKFVCGKVNSKNAMGGYVGYKNFVYIDGQIPLIENEKDPLTNETIKTLCNH